MFHFNVVFSLLSLLLPLKDEVGNPLLPEGGHSQQSQAAGSHTRGPGVKKKGRLAIKQQIDSLSMFESLRYP